MQNVKKYFFNTIIIGSGAAGLAAAARLCAYGVRNVAVLTEDANGGTSVNSGSDKQTYYKLSQSGGADSPHLMAEDIFAGGCTDGDTALCEAACSTRAFMYLAELGVKFPYNEYGEYVGYITDHDKRGRAASAGPYTSSDMARALYQKATASGAEILDGVTVLKLIVSGGVCRGAIALGFGGELCAFFAAHTVIATGGPGGIYGNSVYPVGHTGATGLLIEAGATLQNMTEWQYGLASCEPRWNVSGSYMQCLPRFVSSDDKGEYDFLTGYYTDIRGEYEAIFDKGSQWPFDVLRINGSSRLDLLVREQTDMGRDVYLDFTRNPRDCFDAGLLTEKCKSYLFGAHALMQTPAERLRALNEPAYRFYLEHGVDLERDRLKISLCAQHCNGGASVDTNWQTDIKELFAVGEAAGTHGVYRPGGCALNAGQVGALRAAEYIAKSKITPEQCDISDDLVKIKSVLCPHGMTDAEDLRAKLACEMSRYCSSVRDTDALGDMINKTKKHLEFFSDTVSSGDGRFAYKLYDALLTRLCVLSCSLEYSRTGVSRGSAIYKKHGDADMTGFIQTFRLCGLDTEIKNRPVRQIPDGGGVFENVWRDFIKA